MTSSYDFTDTDYFSNIVKYLDGYCDLKKLSEINKSSNAFIKLETNLKDIVRTKRNKYNCDMLERNLIKKFRYENDNDYDYRKTLAKLKKSTKNYITLTDKECFYMRFRNDVELYTKKMNKKCLPYLEDIITYYFNEKNKINAGVNIQKTSLYISKYLYNIILSSKNNYKLKNENVVIWLSHHI